ncbi:AraC-type DNA-binding protein [Tistlia consotensis]|uniref:AraC-type DNA-binding protein n=1 Tax=Tistlia consotensis USBA 355 TaxID=560819 RepID=A0A1Y6BL49_9PROT|nr:AraC family transcriptional regulator [Tistlia consotensis]SMF17241.1 AraC-type DNA-binding protein [Tistlia consotensis USBA 355]SNR40593.1 AraC-type DNA-binding protein [Tistlia consotensis]
MHRHLTTGEATPPNRARHWNRAIAEAYFPLELTFRDAGRFEGSLDLWDLGGARLSRLATDGIRYRRHSRHLLRDEDDAFLITVPTEGEVRFAQDGREVVSRAGSFVIERSYLPYRFDHAEPAVLWILRVGGAALRARLPDPEGLASLSVDATDGAGRLFSEMLRLLPGCVAGLDGPARAAVERQLLDLLGLALDGDRPLGESRESPVRQAHLLRVRRYLRRNLGSGDLTPASVAAACGLSVRYLHQLFHDSGTPFGAWIREERLRRADAALGDPRSDSSIAAVAYDWGFGDQAQFSRHYRARFGRTPSERRAEARRRGGG